ncbi:hypothetical protein [Cytobacillus kochii]|uniref:hypothetical protein n=1 Tax=Cytobacillus kochii TaxID=859143 RepID=UPI00402A71C6
MRVILSVSMIVVGSFLLSLTVDQLGRNGNGIMHIIALGMCFLAIIVVRKRRVSLKTTILKDKKVLLSIVFFLTNVFHWSSSTLPSYKILALLGHRINACFIY